ncbi:MAG TPA: exodeoxyribonuclease VII large subunit, partial [Microbacteriaceae bacterium]|nr:exodeoxyribonuclease VII large subunit [Microbacteriaceae bacterium]
DLRASTPTDAAKRVVPDVAEQLALVRESRARLTARLSQRLTHDQANLEQLRSRPVLREPERMLRERDAELEYALSRGRGRLEQRLDTAHTEVHALRGSLRALSPRHTLERGYAIVHLADGAGDAIVRDAAAAPAGTELVITLARGTVAAQSAGERQE